MQYQQPQGWKIKKKIIHTSKVQSAILINEKYSKHKYKIQKEILNKIKKLGIQVGLT